MALQLGTHPAATLRQSELSRSFRLCHVNGTLTLCYAAGGGPGGVQFIRVGVLNLGGLHLWLAALK